MLLAALLAAAGGTFAAPMPAAAQGTWTPMSTTGAPSARDLLTAVWTGSKMIVWGGEDTSYTNTGSTYDPATDSWTATSTTGAPEGRRDHVAVWTGSKMIVWGGYRASWRNTGGVYDPATDSWTATATAGAPSARDGHTAVWTGSKMIVWGGRTGLPLDSQTNTGGIYDPATDSWTATSTTGAPTGRAGHVAVWTGSKMVVWGGLGAGYYLANGGVYDPLTNSWTATAASGAPSARAGFPSVWTGSRMIVWGGLGGGLGSGPRLNTGGVYDPATNSWTATSTAGAPTPRYGQGLVWTGSKMVVWGGSEGFDTNTGGVYDPATDSWTATSTAGAPTARQYPVTLWTGSRMIVWGGSYGTDSLNTGATYSDPNLIPPGSFHTVTPCRVLDTRDVGGPTLGTPIACGTGRSFAVVGGECGVPSSATAVSLNLTGTGSTAPGNLRLYPAGSAVPPVSALNYVRGITRANNAIAALGADGRISVLCSPSGSTHVILDVNGYFE
jgi:N-acetylneuraminic acid mutarotase